MNQKYSLKYIILFFLVSFAIIMPIAIGIITSYHLYNTKIDTLSYAQDQSLKHIVVETNELLEKIENISIHIQKKYQNDNKLLKNIIDINDNITSIIILDKKGTITELYASRNLNIHKGFDYSNKEYFKEILNGKEYFWSNIFFSTINESQTFSYSFRIKDKIGVIFVKPSHIETLLKIYKNVDNSYMIRIYDNNGIVILNLDEPHLQNQRANALSQNVYLDLIKKVKPFEQTIFLKNNSKKRDFGMYMTLKKTGWNIVIRECYEHILNDIKNMIIEIIMIVLFFIIISTFIIVKISKKLFASLENLENISLSIANGSYNSQISGTYFKEFDGLINSFKNMQHEIKKREVSLHKSVKSFESLVDSTMEAILLHDKGVCFEVNEVSVKLFGYDSKEEMINKDILDFIADETKEIVKRKLHLNYKPYEIKMVRKDGSEFSALIQGNFMELNEKIVKITTIIDISEIKEKDKLLFQQSKMAAMGEMIGNIAHQWRQPLSTISTAASGMKFQKEFGQLEDEDFDMSVVAILNSTQYLSRTIDDFRNFFKSDKQMKNFSINSVIDKSVILMESSLKSNFINVYKEMHEKVELYGFENELMQALMNIINNAKDAFYTQDTDLDEKLLLITLKKDKTHASIIIKDNAGGIARDVMPKIFEPYFTTKHKSQGTGIGLYMSHQIICDHMNGTLSVNNEKFMFNDNLYEGAVFTIKLKFNKDENINNYMI